MKIPWLIAVLALVLAGYLGIRAQRAEDRADLAEGVLAHQEQLANLAEGFQPARFVRADAMTLTYGLPQQTEINGQTFVNYDEQTADWSTTVDIFGPRLTQSSGVAALFQLLGGTPISIRTSLNDQGQTIVEAVYVP